MGVTWQKKMGIALLGVSNRVFSPFSVFLDLEFCAHLGKVVLSVLNRCGCFQYSPLSKVDHFGSHSQTHLTFFAF